eukprot:13998-Chlamydomonas_euryale.AAC.2
MLAACGPPGGGRTPVPPRLARHFTLLALPAPGEGTLRAIFGTILGGFLGNFFTPGAPQRPGCLSRLTLVLHKAHTLVRDKAPVPDPSDPPVVQKPLLLVHINALVVGLAALPRAALCVCRSGGRERGTERSGGGGARAGGVSTLLHACARRWATAAGRCHCCYLDARLRPLADPLPHTTHLPTRLLSYVPETSAPCTPLPHKNTHTSHTIPRPAGPPCGAPTDVKSRMLKSMVDCTVEIYQRCVAELLPTPAKSHYAFNLRDVSKVFQGLVAIRPGQCPDAKATLTRLWVHENMRVFHDRLVCDGDKRFFTTVRAPLLFRTPRVYGTHGTKCRAGCVAESGAECGAEWARARVKVIAPAEAATALPSLLRPSPCRVPLLAAFVSLPSSPPGHVLLLTAFPYLPSSPPCHIPVLATFLSLPHSCPCHIPVLATFLSLPRSSPCHVPLLTGSQIAHP